MRADERNIAQERAETADTQALLNVATTGEVACEGLEVVRPSFVRRENGAQLGSEAGIDAPLLGALGDRAETPEGRRQRRDCEEEEIEREFVLEACKHRPTVGWLALVVGEQCRSREARAGRPRPRMPPRCGIRGCRFEETA